jgi:hypothetical protein
MAYLGDTEIDAHTDNFNICDVIVTPPDDSPQVDAQIQVEYPGPPDPDATSTTKNGSITIEWKQLDNGDCGRVVTTPDIAFKLDVTGGHRADLCQLADVETRAVVSRLTDGTPLSQRKIPSGSLASLDACSLLDPSALTATGVDPAAVQQNFEGWDCSYGDGDRTVDLQFDQGDSGGGSLLMIGTHIAYMRAEGGEGVGTHDCDIAIKYQPISGGIDPVGEWIQVVFTGSQSSDSLCARAKTLATDVEPHLPQ